MTKKKKVTDEHIFVSPNGIIFSKKWATTPAGELAFPALAEPVENYNKNGHEYKLELHWANRDELEAQKAYDPFTKQMDDFIARACPEVPRDQLVLPFQEKDLYKDEPERGTHWVLRARLDSKAKNKPKCYDFKTKQEIPEAEVASKFGFGDKVCIRGAFYYSPTLIEGNLTHLIKVRMANVIHVEDGVRMERQDGIPEDMDDDFFGPAAEPKPARKAARKKAAASSEDEEF